MCALVPILCNCAGVGSSIAASVCSSTPIDFSVRRASWAAAIEAGRPMASGSIMPGNRTAWRTGKMMSASCGSGRGCVSPESVFCCSATSAISTSAFPDQAQDKTPAHEFRPLEFEPTCRQPDSAFEAAIRNLQAVDRRAPCHRRQDPRSGDGQFICVERSLDLLGRDTGQRRDDPEPLSRFEDIDRWFPTCRLWQREARPKELAMQAFGALQHVAGFTPHPASRIVCEHQLTPGRPRAPSGKAGLGLARAEALNRRAYAHLPFDRGAEILRRVSPIVPHAVDEEARCPIDPAFYAAQEIRADLGRVGFVDQRVAQFQFREFKDASERQIERQTEPILVLVEAVMHLPEFAMRAGKFGGLCGGFRVRMRLAQGKMPEDKSQPLPEMLLDKLDDRMRQSAIRTFVVAVLDERGRCIRRALGMVTLRDWNFERCHPCPPVFPYVPRHRECRRHRD